MSGVDEARVRRALLALLDEYSPSFAEGPVIEVASALLAEGGLEVERVSLDEAEPERANVLARLGPAPAALWLVGHLDTVPFMGSGAPTVREEDGCVHAVGAADMKSGCAAMIEAMIAARESGVALERGVQLALLVGEEENGDGALAVQPSIPEDALVVVGEPTSLHPCLAHYTYLELRVVARGRRAHAALPDVGASAIHGMLRVLDGVLAAADALGPSAFVNIREIEGGNGMFIVADHCEAEIDLHLAPDVDPRAARASLESRAREIADAIGVELEVVLLLEGAGHEAASDEAYRGVRAAFERTETPWRPVAFRSHSDVPLLRKGGVPPIVLGPGALEVAHTRSEHVHLDEVGRAARLYRALIDEVCGAS